jgi:hypothetical protein
MDDKRARVGDVLIEEAREIERSMKARYLPIARWIFCGANEDCTVRGSKLVDDDSSSTTWIIEAQIELTCSMPRLRY